MKEVQAVYRSLSTSSQKSFVNHLKVFGRLTEISRNSECITEYSKLKMLEGQLNMELFHDTSSESMKSHPKFPEYKRTVNRMIRVGNNLDAMLDLNDDYNQGTTQIKPTVFNKLYLLKDLIWQATKSVKGFNIHTIRKIIGFESWDSFH